MAATVAGKINLAFSALLQNLVGLGSAQSSISETYLKNFSSGVGADQADRIYSERDKAIAAATDIDLAGSLLDALGGAFVLARVKALLVIAADANTGNIVIGGDAASVPLGFGNINDTWSVGPGGIFFAYKPDATGWPVTATTGDILQFAPSAGTQTFSYAVLGASA